MCYGLCPIYELFAYTGDAVVLYSLQITGQALLEPDKYGEDIRQLYNLGTKTQGRGL